MSAYRDKKHLSLKIKQLQGKYREIVEGESNLFYTQIREKASFLLEDLLEFVEQTPNFYGDGILMDESARNIFKRVISELNDVLKYYPARKEEGGNK